MLSSATVQAEVDLLAAGLRATKRRQPSVSQTLAVLLEAFVQTDVLPASHCITAAMTGIAGMRKPAQLDLDTTAMEKDGGSDSDSVATASTEVSVHSDDETYDVEEIVAENEERGKYLVKWAK